MNERNWDASLSAALDGELDGADLTDLLDAMADDLQCRRTWRRLRALDRRLMPLVRPATSTLRPARPHRTWRAWWIAPLAAAALLALLVLRPDAVSRRSLPDPDGDPLIVRLAADPGKMTEVRFVELVVEILEADQRYQDKMREVLEEIRPPASLAEGSGGESDTPRTERLALHRVAGPDPGSGELTRPAAADIH